MSAILRAANSGDGFKPISVMLWRTLDRGPLSAGLRRLAIIGNGRIRSGTGTCAGFWFSPDPSTRPLRKPTARSQLVPEPIVEFGALAAVTDIRGMKEFAGPAEIVVANTCQADGRRLGGWTAVRAVP